MKWKISSEGHVTDEYGTIVCSLPKNADDRYVALIKYAPEMFDAIIDFLDGLESTRIPRKPKKHFNRFQKIRDNVFDY